MRPHSQRREEPNNRTLISLSPVSVMSSVMASILCFTVTAPFSVAFHHGVPTRLYRHTQFMNALCHQLNHAGCIQRDSMRSSPLIALHNDEIKNVRMGTLQRRSSLRASAQPFEEEGEQNLSDGSGGGESLGDQSEKGSSAPRARKGTQQVNPTRSVKRKVPKGEKGKKRKIVKKSSSVSPLARDQAQNMMNQSSDGSPPQQVYGGPGSEIFEQQKKLKQGARFQAGPAGMGMTTRNAKTEDGEDIPIVTTNEDMADLSLQGRNRMISTRRGGPSSSSAGRQNSQSQFIPPTYLESFAQPRFDTPVSSRSRSNVDQPSFSGGGGGGGGYGQQRPQSQVQGTQGQQQQEQEARRQGGGVQTQERMSAVVPQTTEEEDQSQQDKALGDVVAVNFQYYSDPRAASGRQVHTSPPPLMEELSTHEPVSIDAWRPQRPGGASSPYEQGSTTPPMNQELSIYKPVDIDPWRHRKSELQRFSAPMDPSLSNYQPVDIDPWRSRRERQPTFSPPMDADSIASSYEPVSIDPWTARGSRDKQAPPQTQYRTPMNPELSTHKPVDINPWRSGRTREQDVREPAPGTFFQDTQSDWKPVDINPWTGRGATDGPNNSAGTATGPSRPTISSPYSDDNTFDGPDTSKGQSENTFFQTGSKRDEAEAWKTVNIDPWEGGSEDEGSSTVAGSEADDISKGGSTSTTSSSGSNKPLGGPETVTGQSSEYGYSSSSSTSSGTPPGYSGGENYGNRSQGRGMYTTGDNPLGTGGGGGPYSPGGPASAGPGPGPGRQGYYDGGRQGFYDGGGPPPPPPYGNRMPGMGPPGGPGPRPQSGPFGGPPPRPPPPPPPQEYGHDPAGYDPGPYVPPNRNPPQYNPGGGVGNSKSYATTDYKRSNGISTPPSSVTDNVPGTGRTTTPTGPGTGPFFSQGSKRDEAESWKPVDPTPWGRPPQSQSTNQQRGPPDSPSGGANRSTGQPPARRVSTRHPDAGATSTSNPYGNRSGAGTGSGTSNSTPPPLQQQQQTSQPPPASSSQQQQPPTSSSQSSPSFYASSDGGSNNTGTSIPSRSGTGGTADSSRPPPGSFSPYGGNKTNDQSTNSDNRNNSAQSSGNEDGDSSSDEGNAEQDKKQ